MLIVECIVEFIGVIIIGVVGVWTGNLFLTGIAITICFFIGRNSGLSKGFFNPAITLMMGLVKQQSWRDVSWYILSQLSASIAVWLLYIKYY